MTQLEATATGSGCVPVLLSNELDKAVLVSMELGDAEFCIGTIEQNAATAIPLAVQVDGAAVDLVLWVKAVTRILDGEHRAGWDLDVTVSDVVFHDTDRWFSDLNIVGRLVVLADADTAAMLPEGYFIAT